MRFEHLRAVRLADGAVVLGATDARPRGAARAPTWVLRAVPTWGLLAVLACASACSSGPGVTDSDGDGFGRAEDCADGDPLRFPGADERCNGFDDDCDGAVDEGFPDTDGDGRLDCYGDASCELVEGPALEVERTCPPAPERPWDVVEKWSWRAPDEPYLGDSHVSLIVAHLDDEDGDGQVGSAGDAVEVLAMFAADVDTAQRWRGRLAIVDGVTGTLRSLSEPEWYARSGLAVADVDVDGTPDIVGVGREGGLTPEDPPVLRARALTPGGDELWQSEPICPECFSVVGPPFDRVYTIGQNRPVRPTVADLDADGQPEVLVDRFVLDGATGETLLRLEIQPNRSMVPVDLDGDGEAELLLSGRAYRQDGTLLWAREGGLPVVWDDPFVLDVDGDGHPEAGFLSNRSGDTTVDILSGDGEDLLRLSLRHPLVPVPLMFSSSPPTVGPATASTLAATVGFTGRAGRPGVDPTIWQVTVTPVRAEEVATVTLRSAPTGGPGVDGFASFDFDGDGTPEGLSSRVSSSYALTSRGEPVWFGGYTQSLVAILLTDLDADGSCDWLAPGDEQGAAPALLTAYGHRDGSWMACGRTWPQFEFRPGWIDDDGTVSTDAESRATGMTRARPITEPTLDVEVAIVGRCLASCAGELRVVAQVGNRGTYPLPEGVARVEVTTVDGEVLASAPVPALGGLEVGDPVELVVPDLEGVPDRRVVVRVALTDDAPAQCDTANDRVEWDFSEACTPLR